MNHYFLKSPNNLASRAGSPRPSLTPPCFSLPSTLVPLLTQSGWDFYPHTVWLQRCNSFPGLRRRTSSCMTPKYLPHSGPFPGRFLLWADDTVKARAPSRAALADGPLRTALIPPACHLPSSVIVLSYPGVFSCFSQTFPVKTLLLSFCCTPRRPDRPAECLSFTVPATRGTPHTIATSSVYRHISSYRASAPNSLCSLSELNEEPSPKQANVVGLWQSFWTTDPNFWTKERSEVRGKAPSRQKTRTT